MAITYHGTPKDHWDSLDVSQPYLPPEFEHDGFIHCTDGREAIPIVLTLHYKDWPGDWLILTIDKDRLASTWRYDDPAEVYPHIYGPLNRDAIVEVKPIERADDGTFLLAG